LTTERESLNQLEAVYLRLRKAAVKRITAIKYRANSRGSSGTSCCAVEVWTNTVKLSNTVIAGFAQCSTLFTEGKMFVKNGPAVACKQSEWC